MTERTKTRRRLTARLALAVLLCAILHLCLCPGGDCAICPYLRALMQVLALSSAARICLFAPSRLYQRAGAICLRRFFETLRSREVLLRC